MHVVKQGESLSLIAKRYGSSVADLQQANPEISDPNHIVVGQKIIIPQSATGGDELSSSNNAQGYEQTSGNSQSNDIDNTVQDCPNKDEEVIEKKTTNIRVSLFFDGTANNKTNTEHRLNNTGTYNSNRGPMGSGSYENDYSNIAKLEQIYVQGTDAEHTFSIYVEGIGTQDNARDIPQGLAEGSGITGVIAKVEKGLEETIDKIEKLAIEQNTDIEFVQLDAFGFSRGAAAARYMVYAALDKADLKIKTRLESLGLVVNEVNINFVGLYDTVASYGFKHTNDTSDLNLTAVSKAKTVLQLAAAEEHRSNFRLTNINSCSANGLQIFLPGVHSDVGGGYVDNASEIDHQILDIDTVWAGDETQQRFKDEKAWLKRKGWYYEDEIEEVNFWNELKVNRSGIKNTYSRIPLYIMANFASDTGMSFKSSKLKTTHAVPSALNTIKGLVDAHIAKASYAGSTWQYWWNMETSAMKSLRHDYLHFSSSYGGTNTPQFVKGKRRRKIQDG